jgi:hypothetical protein
MAHFSKGLRPELKTILASQGFLSFSHLSNKAIQVERAREEEKGHLKKKFQVLRAQQQDRHQRVRSFRFPPKGLSYNKPAGSTPSRFSQPGQSSLHTRDGNGFKTRGYRDYKPVPARLMLNPYPHPLPATGSVCYPNPLPAGLWHPR